MSEYVLFYGMPALVIEREDGNKYIRLASIKRRLSEAEISKKWRNLRPVCGMTESEFWNAYKYEHVGTELPLDVMVASGVATPLPVGWWQANIPAYWWRQCGRKVGGAK